MELRKYVCVDFLHTALCTTASSTLETTDMRVIKRLRQKEWLGKERTGKLTDHADNSPQEKQHSHAAPSQSAHLIVSSRLEELATVQHWFQNLIARFSRALSTSAWVDESFDQLNLAIAEGFTNAVRHAHADLPSSTPILIECEVRSHQIEICIFDQGNPFDPDSLVEPQPGTLREGGYGWFLLRRLVNQVTYSPVQKDSLRERLSQAEFGHAGSGHSGSGHAGSGHSIDSCVILKREDIEQICNCLKLVKRA